jgi:branched-chain amino acid transport system ATP-binding protein
VIALSVEDLKVHFGGVRALDGVSLVIRKGGIHAVIGPNGAGKTSLANALTGVYPPTSGRILLDGRDITGLPAHALARHGLTRTFQNLQVFWTMSVIENVMAGYHMANRSGFWRGLLRTPTLVRREQELEAEALDLLKLVDLHGKARLPAGALAYGELKRLEIARALACRPAVLFLDEPVAGCTALEKRALGEIVRHVADARGTTIVLIEHDMRLVMAISDLVTVLVRGRVLAEGEPSAIRSDPAVRAAYLGAASARNKEPDHAVAY